MHKIDYTGNTRAKKTTEFGKVSQRLTEEKSTHVHKIVRDELHNLYSGVQRWLSDKESFC